MSSKFDFGARIKATSYDDLTGASGAQPSDAVKTIPIAKLHPFKMHPFKVLDNEDMEALTESVKENGILTPLTVRKDCASDGYEIISGHRRKHAAERAGLTEVPVFIVDMDTDSAVINMVDSNLQRTKILPSEKAFSCMMKYNALKRQGKRTDLEVDAETMDAAEKVAKDSGDSKMQVRRYIRLTHLIQELLDLVDAGTLKLVPAVAVSYLSTTNQRELYKYMNANHIKSISMEQADRLKESGKQDDLTVTVINLIFNPVSNRPRKYKVSLDDTEVKAYFKPDASEKEMHDTILMALDEWRQSHPE